MARQASVLISDDLWVSLVGKFIVNGVYTTDIVIPTDPTVGGQLVFLFQIVTEIDDLFESLQLQVTLPGVPPTTAEIPIAPFFPTPGHTRWLLHWPLLVRQPVLRPGRIEAKVIHEKGEILPPTPWISLATQAPPTPS
jgi:hypothetical protein